MQVVEPVVVDSFVNTHTRAHAHKHARMQTRMHAHTHTHTLSIQGPYRRQDSSNYNSSDYKPSNQGPDSSDQKCTTIIEQEMFTPSNAKTDKPVVVDIGLRWTKDPSDDCKDGDCPSHKVHVLSFNIEEKEVPVEEVGTVAAVTSAVAIGVSLAVNSVAGSAMSATSMGFVQQLQFSGILARLKGCPDEFKTFSVGFDWTLLDWPLPWEATFRWGFWTNVNNQTDQETDKEMTFESPTPVAVPPPPTTDESNRRSADNGNDIVDASEDNDQVCTLVVGNNNADCDCITI